LLKENLASKLCRGRTSRQLERDLASDLRRIRRTRATKDLKRRCAGTIVRNGRLVKQAAFNAPLYARIGDPDIGDPVTLSARKPRFDILVLEIGRGSAETRRVDIFQHVAVDHCVELISDLTRDQWHRAAP